MHIHLNPPISAPRTSQHTQRSVPSCLHREWVKAIAAHAALAVEPQHQGQQPSQWCQKWDSHADHSFGKKMASKYWPIWKPVTRSMIRGGVEDSSDSDEEPQPDLSYQPSAEGSAPAVDGASAVPCPESLEHEPLTSRPPEEIHVSTAVCLVTRQSNDVVLCSSSDDVGRPVGHHMLSGPSIVRSEPQVSNLSRVDSAGSSELPLVSIPQSVRPCEFSSSRTGAFGQSGPTLSFPLQVRSSVTGSSAQFAQLPQT